MHLLLLPDSCRRRPLDRLKSTRQSTLSASPQPYPRESREKTRRCVDWPPLSAPPPTSNGMSRVRGRMGDDNEALMMMMPTDYPLSCHDPLTPSGCAADIALADGVHVQIPMLGLVCIFVVSRNQTEPGAGLLFNPPYHQGGRVGSLLVH